MNCPTGFYRGCTVKKTGAEPIALPLLTKEVMDGDCGYRYFSERCEDKARYG